MIFSLESCFFSANSTLNSRWTEKLRPQIHRKNRNYSKLLNIQEREELKNLHLHLLEMMEVLLSMLKQALLLWLKYFHFTVPWNSRTVNVMPSVNATILGWIHQPWVYRLGWEGWEDKDILTAWDNPPASKPTEMSNKAEPRGNGRKSKNILKTLRTASQELLSNVIVIFLSQVSKTPTNQISQDLF